MLSSRNSSHRKLCSPATDHINSGNKTSSLSTPALLFYKPTNSPPPPAKPQQICENHQTTTATFYSCTHDDEEEIIFYCNKCAGLLTEQGFEVHSINDLENTKPIIYSNSEGKPPKNQPVNIPVAYPYPEREEEVEQFLDKLSANMNILSGSTEQVRDILVSSEEFYGQQIEEVNEYFETIIQSLELEKNKCYNHILIERQNAEKGARDTLKKLSEG